MTGLVIIADDLTGAADAAAPFALKTGTSVVLDAGSEWPPEQIIAVDTDSRYFSAREAAAVVEATVDRAIASGRDSIFKKVDSLLRGNVGVEVAAVLRALARHGRESIAIVAPAFPSVGRTTIGGVVHVGGVPLERAGAPADFVAALAEGGLRARVVRITDYADLPSLVDCVRDVRAAGFDAAVIDCATDKDLDLVARAADELAPSLLVGTGGLAGRLALREPNLGTPREFVGPALDGRLLVVMGSYSATAREQLSDLVAAGVHHVRLNHADLGSPAIGAVVRDALQTSHVVVTPDPDEPVDKSRAAEVAGAMGRLVAAAAPATRGIVICGGETGRASLRELGVGGLSVLAEIQAGTVLHAVPGSELLLVTKSGAFGGPHAVTRVLEQLMSSDSPKQGEQ